MKTILILLPYLISVLIEQTSLHDSHVFQKDEPPQIRVELRLQSGERKDSGKISFKEIEFFVAPKTISKVGKLQNGSLLITAPIEKKSWLIFDDLIRLKKTGFYYAEPGDEVVISSIDNGLQFSGKEDRKSVV